MCKSRKAFRKLLSLTLCLIMVCSVMPFAVLGAGAEETGYKVGDIIKFGSYPQSEITDITGLTKNKDYVVLEDIDSSTVKYYAIEPIEWKVLDPETGLCVSNYALNAMAFGSGSYNYNISKVRTWLTDTFYSSAFTDTEKSEILQLQNYTLAYNSDLYCVNMIEDKVFLLSVQEASDTSYFADDSARICYPTAYAIANNAFTDNDNNNSCRWWLRSPGESSEYAAYVNSDGDVYQEGYYTFYDGDCVRPALYLNFKSEIFKSEITLNANNGSDETIKNTVASFKNYYPECAFTNGTKTFCGWYKDAECQQPWNETDIVYGDMTLYAGWTELKTGDIIKLGSYPQSEITDITGLTENVDYVIVTDTSTSTDKYYAIEPIEWKVLDAETGLCVSNYALNAMAFDGDSNDYANSDIRAWLYGADGTGTFYTNAFTDTEKSVILSNNIVTYKSSFGADTEIASTLTDKVFLLSTEEAYNTSYFADSSARICYPTAYAIATGARTDSNYNNSCNWWLRSPSLHYRYAALARSSGRVDRFADFFFEDSNFSSGDVCVRPALYLNLESELFKSEITLDTNNGTGDTIKQTAYKFKEFYPECPFVNKGYSFTGWFTDKQCTEEWTETDMVEGDMTLYAGWKVNVPQLRINEGSNMWEVSYDNGTTWESLGVEATGKDGSDGSNGADGVGIASTSINENGELIIKLTNGNEFNLGKITGTDGKDGKDGTNGTNGTDGKDGTNGTDGKDAATIVGMHYNEKGELIVEMSDGTSYNAGKPTEQQSEQEEEDDNTEKLSFFRKIINFLKSIIEKIKNMF